MNLNVYIGVIHKKEGEKKMKKRKCSVLLFLVLLVCLSFSSMNALAADERLGEVVDGSLLPDNVADESTIYSVRRGAFLNYGTGGITNDGNRQVSVSGQTVCYSICDKVKVTVHLQRLVGDSWVNVTTLGPKTAQNTSYVSTSNSYKVTGGYYYRVKGSHVAIDGGNTENVTSFTNGIWISK